MLGAVEAHMLEEVSQAVLVRGFLDGAHIGAKIKLDTLCRKLVMADVVGKAVFQLTYLDSGIPRKGPEHRIVLCGHTDCQEQGNEQRKETLHYFTVKVFAKIIIIY
jgi:hypothetical protein